MADIVDKRPERLTRRRNRRRITSAVLAILCFIATAIGVAGYAAGNIAQKRADSMESYEYINNDRCLQKLSSLPDAGADFSFAVLGDVQSGTPQLSRAIKALKPGKDIVFLVQTGDIVRHADPGHYMLLLSELARSGLSRPLFVIPGNHDVRRDNRNLFGHYFGSKQFQFQYGGSLFLFTDNSTGPLEDSQYLLLKEVLENNRDQVQHVFLFIHRQPIYWEGNGERPDEHLYEKLFELVRKYHIDYVFSGHWHGYHRERRNDTVYIVNGRGGDYDTNESMTPCYITMVDVQKGSIRDRCIELPASFSVLLESSLNDWFIAHIGELEIRDKSLSLAVLVFWGTATVFFIGRSLHPAAGRMDGRRRSRKDSGRDMG